MTIKPFKHQTISLKHDEKSPEVFDCSDPGTGKTYVRIMAYAKRRRAGKAGKLLVVAGKSLLRSVWASDFRKFAPDMQVVVSTAGKHDQTFAQEADVYVINHDAIKWAAAKQKSFFKGFTDLAVDESTAFKHHTSQRSKAAQKVSRYFTRRCCMTGTPNGNSITDVWHQMMIVDGGKRLGKSFYAFRNAVCEPVQVGNHVNAIQWVDKDGAEEAVFAMLGDVVIRHKLEECVDLPENRQYAMPYYLTPMQRKVYTEMQERQIAEIYGDPLALEKIRLGANIKPLDHITAAHASSVATKLLQIASGAVYTGVADDYKLIDTARYEFILDLVEERRHPLVFFFWKHQRAMLVAEAEKRSLTFAVIDGSVPEREREMIVTRYQKGEYDCVFAHPKSTAHGLTFTRGSATIWASPTYDLEIFKQGSRRQFRIGQTNKTENIVVCAQDTIEQTVYEKMLDKDARMTKLLDLAVSTPRVVNELEKRARQSRQVCPAADFFSPDVRDRKSRLGPLGHAGLRDLLRRGLHAQEAVDL